MNTSHYDAFISHAYEDKDDFVRPLSIWLMDRGLKVWYDEFSLKLGDSIRRSIDRGLSNSRYGIVVLSPCFFQKNWPQEELDGLVSKERSGIDKVILPIWHKVDYDDVLNYSPPLADKKAIKSDKGINIIGKAILEVVLPDEIKIDSVVKINQAKRLALSYFKSNCDIAKQMKNIININKTPVVRFDTVSWVAISPSALNSLIELSDIMLTTFQQLEYANRLAEQIVILENNPKFPSGFFDRDNISFKEIEATANRFINNAREQLDRFLSDILIPKIEELLAAIKNM